MSNDAYNQIFDVWLPRIGWWFLQLAIFIVSSLLPILFMASVFNPESTFGRVTVIVTGMMIGLVFTFLMTSLAYVERHFWTVKPRQLWMRFGTVVDLPKNRGLAFGDTEWCQKHCRSLFQATVKKNPGVYEEPHKRTQAFVFLSKKEAAFFKLSRL